MKVAFRMKLLATLTLLVLCTTVHGRARAYESAELLSSSSSSSYSSAESESSDLDDNSGDFGSRPRTTIKRSWYLPVWRFG